jgi:hypothetical protein
MTYNAGLELVFCGSRQAYLNSSLLVLPQKWSEVLALLALHPEGLSGEALLGKIYGEGGCMNTLKVTLSRMRQVLPIASRPYRVDGCVHADFLEVETLLSRGEVENAARLYKGELLPFSGAPAITEHRDYLEELVRQTLIANHQRLEITKPFADDLTLWEALLEHLTTDDKRYPFVKAKVAWLRRDWGLSTQLRE